MAESVQAEASKARRRAARAAMGGLWQAMAQLPRDEPQRQGYLRIYRALEDEFGPVLQDPPAPPRYAEAEGAS